MAETGRKATELIKRNNYTSLEHSNVPRELCPRIPEDSAIRNI